MEFKKTNDFIEGVELKKMDKIKTYDSFGDENGWLIDILRGTDGIKLDGKNFSQIYITVAYPSKVKGFHWHKTKVDMFFVVKGTIKLVLVDTRKESSTKGYVNEFIMGENGENVMVRVPRYVKHAIKNIGDDNAYILNYMDPGYNPTHPDSYEWDGYEID